MKALLLIAHGSRRESSNQEVRDLAKCLAEDARPDFSTVVPAFLELAEPDIPTEAPQRGAFCFIRGMRGPMRTLRFEPSSA